MPQVIESDQHVAVDEIVRSAHPHHATWTVPEEQVLRTHVKPQRLTFGGFRLVELAIKFGVGPALFDKWLKNTPASAYAAEGPNGFTPAHWTLLYDQGVHIKAILDHFRGLSVTIVFAWKNEAQWHTRSTFRTSVLDLALRMRHEKNVGVDVVEAIEKDPAETAKTLDVMPCAEVGVSLIAMASFTALMVLALQIAGPVAIPKIVNDAQAAYFHGCFNMSGMTAVDASNFNFSQSCEGIEFRTCDWLELPPSQTVHHDDCRTENKGSFVLNRVTFEATEMLVCPKRRRRGFKIATVLDFKWRYGELTTHPQQTLRVSDAVLTEYAFSSYGAADTFVPVWSGGMLYYMALPVVCLLLIGGLRFLSWRYWWSDIDVSTRIVTTLWTAAYAISAIVEIYFYDMISQSNEFWVNMRPGAQLCVKVILLLRALMATDWVHYVFPVTYRLSSWLTTIGVTVVLLGVLTSALLASHPDDTGDLKLTILGSFPVFLLFAAVFTAGRVYYGLRTAPEIRRVYRGKRCCLECIS